MPAQDSREAARPESRSSVTGKRSSHQRSPSRETDGRHKKSPRAQQRQTSDLRPPTGDDPAAPAHLRLNGAVGGISKITYQDALKLESQIRPLTPEERMRGRLAVIQVQDLAFWAEFTLDGHRFYYVAVLTRNSQTRYSSINVFQAMLAGMQFRSPSVYRDLNTPTVRLLSGREARVRLEPSTSSVEPPTLYMRVPLEPSNPTSFFEEPDADVGQSHVLFMQNWAGLFSTQAHNRLVRAGIPPANMQRHLTTHVQAVTGEPGNPPHSMLPAVATSVFRYASLAVAPQIVVIQEDDEELSDDDGPNPPPRDAGPPATGQFVVTMRPNQLPCVSLPMLIGHMHYLPVTADVDPFSQHPLITASQYIKMYGVTALERRTRIGEVVQDMWSTQGRIRLVVTVVATPKIHVDLTTEPENPIHVQLDFMVIKDRNDQGMGMLGVSLPRSVYEAFSGQF